MVQNPKKNGHCIALTTINGKIISNPILAGDAGITDDDGKALDPTDVENNDKAKGLEVVSK